MLTAAEAAQKWANRLSGAGQNYIDGINRVTSSPMAAAAKNSGAYLAGVQQAVQSGKWQQGLQRVSLADWQNKATTLGANRLGAGANAAQGKMEAFMGQFLPFVANAQAQVKSMPNDSYEARKARMNKMADILHTFKRTK